MHAGVPQPQYAPPIGTCPARTGKDKHNMSTETAANRFIVSSFNAYAGFYQQLAASTLSIHELGNRLIRHAEHARAFRQTEQVRELGLMLANLPLKQFQTAGQYYLGWAMYRSGNHEQARTMLEQVADSGIGTYQARALFSLGTLEAAKHDFASEAYCYLEAFKTSHGLSTKIESVRGIAVIKAKEGYHKSAVKDFEKFLPLAASCDAITYNLYLSSLAVELGESGRKQEARNISQIVLASPFAPAYPEWRETADELKEPSRSFVAVPSMEPEPVEIETIEAHHVSEPEQEQPATIIAFPALKEAPRPQKPERLTPQQFAELTENDKRELILAAIRSGAIQGNVYDKLMGMVGLLKNGPADKILDLEDDAILDDLIVVWAHQIEPEELVAVFSAIRDCDDRIRQRNIIDRIIRIAFEETQESGLTEIAWRNRVERRLPKK
jgi:tetratricopeptide (TPR) repeat protein